MRPYTKRMSPPFTMIGSSVAEVEESRNPNFKKGQTIVILAGWVERGIVNPDAMGKVDIRTSITILLILLVYDKLLFIVYFPTRTPPATLWEA